MIPTLRRTFSDAQSVPFWLLIALLSILWIFGGASRADVMAQPVTRMFAWAVLIVSIFTLKKIQRPASVIPSLILLSSVALCFLQLIPMPATWWTNLPGRDLLADSTSVIGAPAPWRPISISPSATVNALSSLIVPAVCLLLATQITTTRHWQIVTLLLGLFAVSSGIALIQFSGGRIDYPFINDLPGSVSANFANRNHFALIVAIGLLLVPAWVFARRERLKLRLLFASGLLPALLLLSLGTGSRAGILLSVLALFMGLFIARHDFIPYVARYPRKVVVPAGAILVIGIILIIFLSIDLDRAESVKRAIDMRSAEDLRVRSLPTLQEMIFRYFPFGAGMGTFDPAFRISEPNNILQPLYFNHAHNDWIEIVIDGGLAGLLLLCTGVAWFTIRSWKVWMQDPQNSLAQIGSSMMLLVMLASFVDYPARTPFVMAVLVLSAVWMSSSRPSRKIRKQDVGSFAPHRKL
ncbi:O-antigen ligase family protein [Qipengyuania atrilutea]|uniref:O-antigen ligase family protein n=1 Tax=Qipengyuania atrilutea TaxID=2744473 RepID=A0A850H2G2_9SPHN|nr:O-antigen ligase family protein [Actirhodobacter atriluteus]NVD44392.1 O-antigen ligase family protein [Actirhodobacter atriluteus]